MSMKLILASQSPRRKELLSHLGLPFTILPSKAEEVSDATDPVAFSLEIALLKGRDILSKIGGDASQLIVSADTIVVHHGVIYGKPKSSEDAYRMLKILSGQTHSVFTSVAILLQDKVRTFTVESQVDFVSIPESILLSYLETKDSLDKAGAYGIQGNALTFISELRGSYSNVVGFPLSHFIFEFRDFLHIDMEKPDWRKQFSAA
ncbi:MAG: Maf family nucleotide pyrophosphatase [Bacteriovoracaceae bacterium]